ncbi:MAG: acyl carrier protein [Syntrophomonadaceae bacterium]|jgi:acyl carrier protein|nr:acyl carrier protein [Syntrophomonadaceae bacterium]MDD3272222.1 acyl carrier protein [Syntrophomonadaceae bacterium]MDD3898290.1 acyl carrier protein [Syntrophomonadaceae bacterium]MDD4561449.1 acyl carrier protein [Syntrophomonadaceae bacterium]
MQEFFEQARRILAEQMEIELESISMDTEFEAIDADSIDIVEMIMALEDIYEVEFPEEDVEDYPTMGSLITALYAYLQKVKND